MTSLSYWSRNFIEDIFSPLESSRHALSKLSICKWKNSAKIVENIIYNHTYIILYHNLYNLICKKMTTFVSSYHRKTKDCATFYDDAPFFANLYS